MQVAAINGLTRILGKSQGFFGLPIRDEVREGNTPVMVSSWTPTPKELEALNAGANVEIAIWGTAHPPIRVEVGKP